MFTHWLSEVTALSLHWTESAQKMAAEDSEKQKEKGTGATPGGKERSLGRGRGFEHFKIPPFWHSSFGDFDFCDSG